MPERPNRFTGKPKMLPSTQTLFVGAIAEGIAILMLVIAVLVSVGSPSATIAIFLVCSVLSIIASALAMALAIVGLVRFRRWWGWNIALLACSIVFNPFVWGLLAVLAL